MSDKNKIEFYIFRHGETDWNRDLIFQGHTDIPLNNTGKAQAAKLADQLLALCPEIILSSDLSRAQETARIANAKISVPILVSDQLRECNLGNAEGMHHDKVNETYGAEGRKRWDSVKPEDLSYGFPNGETKAENVRRLVAYLESFCRLQPHFKKIAVSTHGGCVRRLVHICKGAPEEPVPMPNCVLYKITYDAGTGVWAFGGMNT